MPATAQTAIAVVGIDIGKNSFHIVALDNRGAIVLRQKWSCNQDTVRVPVQCRLTATAPAIAATTCGALRSSARCTMTSYWCCASSHVMAFPSVASGPSLHLSKANRWNAMASYHLSVQVLKRSKGRSAINAAAYRAAARLKDHANNKSFDYTRKRGVVHTEILLPEGAASWLADRERLWNYVEQSEKRRDAQLAREINIALPHELNAEQRRELLLSFVREQFVSRGMVADVCFHDPVPQSGDSPENFHAHIMLPLRQATSTGLRAVKTREWNSDKLLAHWREKWAEHQNRALERAGHKTRVDHRTLAAQLNDARRRGDRAAELALDRMPEIHIGPRADKTLRRERIPKSRNRDAGPFRRQFPGQQPRRRQIHYSKLDRGSRLAHNQAIVEGNLRRLARLIDRWQRLGARFRLHRQWLSKREFETILAAKKVERDRAWQTRRNQEAVIRAMTGGDRPAKHRRKRHTLADHLIGQVDQVLAHLLGIQEKHFKRRIRLNGRPRPRARFGKAGRRRQRLRSFERYHPCLRFLAHLCSRSECISALSNLPSLPCSGLLALGHGV